MSIIITLIKTILFGIYVIGVVAVTKGVNDGLYGYRDKGFRIIYSLISGMSWPAILIATAINNIIDERYNR